jgi:hypothetical protein
MVNQGVWHNLFAPYGKTTQPMRRQLNGTISVWFYYQALDIHPLDSRPKIEPRKPRYKNKTYKNIKPLSWKQMNQLFFQ